MRIIMIGGTRFIGLKAVETLAEQGHDVTIFHRGQTTPQLPSNVQEILGDKRDLAQFQDQFAKHQPDVVIHNILVNEDDACQLIDSFRGITKRVIAVSSGDVYRAYGRLTGIEPGEPVPVPIKEDGLLRETRYPYRNMVDGDTQHPYYDYDKILVEEMLMNTDAFGTTVLRLPMVYGPRDHQRRFYPYVKAMEDKRPAIVMDERMANWRSSYGFIEDVAAAVALATTDERAIGRIYNISEAEALTEKGWIGAIADLLGWTGQVITPPLEILPEDMQGDPFGQDLVVDTTRIRTELGYVELNSRVEALTKTIAWQQANASDDFPNNYADEDKVLAQLDI